MIYKTEIIKVDYGGKLKRNTWNPAIPMPENIGEMWITYFEKKIKERDSTKSLES